MSRAYLVDGVRTPIGRYAGALSAVRPDDLAAHTLRALAERVGPIDWTAVDDVVLGCANQAGEDNRNVARMALLLAGLPESVPGTTVNRLCGSGADAVAIAARSIRAGEADLVVAGGAESMSRAPFVMPKSETAFGRAPVVHDTTIGWRFVNQALEVAYGTDSMGETAENVAAERGISRADQDLFALRSQQRTAKARADGRFDGETTPVTVPVRKGEPLIVERDEHPRHVDLDTLARLKPAFRPGGSVTAGNSSGVNDGAAALLLASERAVDRLGLTPMAEIVSAATAGVAPRVMGLGPIPATRKLLDRTALRVTDIDIVELNEAFAAQTLAVLRDLGLPDDAQHVNPDGGAIALGHPLGASGARLMTTLLNELERTGGRYGLQTMCEGGGMANATIIERV
jgi:3-oxoadipyl-CoA thiolase